MKKYKSLTNDLLQLEKELTENPRLGTPLGQDVNKIRLKISSKNKGKSGGARVISLIDSTLISFTEQTSGNEIIYTYFPFTTNPKLRILLIKNSKI